MRLPFLADFVNSLQSLQVPLISKIYLSEQDVDKHDFLSVDCLVNLGQSSQSPKDVIL